MKEDKLLEDLAPKRKERVIKKKKFYSTKGVTAEVAARRSAAAEVAQDKENPLPRLQKDAILMKFGVTPVVVERGISMPAWKADMIKDRSERPVEVVWNNMVQDWFKATKGLTIPSRQRSSGRGFTSRPSLPNLPASRVIPYPKLFRENLRDQPRSSNLNSKRS